MHWGEEYQSLPNREQCELADWLLKQGVTHIIGSHPHVIQPMELRTNGNQQHAIVYSLGNFISNMSAIQTVDSSLRCNLKNILSPSPSVHYKTIQVIHRRPNLLPLLSIRPCRPMRIHFSMDRPPHSHWRKKLHFISFLLTT